MKNSEFRDWVRIIWIENTEEHLYFKERPYTINEHWKKYKWWLKREFQYQRKKHDS